MARIQTIFTPIRAILARCLVNRVKFHYTHVPIIPQLVPWQSPARVGVSRRRAPTTESSTVVCLTPAQLFAGRGRSCTPVKGGQENVERGDGAEVSRRRGHTCAPAAATCRVDRDRGRGHPDLR